MSEIPKLRHIESEETPVAGMVVEVIQAIEVSRGRGGVDYHTLKHEMDALSIGARALRGALWDLFSEGHVTLTNFDCITLIDQQSSREQLHQVT